ncbi:Uncharacterised protein [Mycobacterium tuberculosis]|nr:Uncharacterised protein [Mycobacterium tuberculosis]
MFGLAAMNGLDVVVSQHGVERRVVGKAVHAELGGLESPAVAPVFHPHPPPAASDLQFGGTVQCDDPAVDDERHPVAQLVGGGHVVRGEKDRAAARLQVHDDVLDLAGVHRVQPGGGLVEEQQLRVVDQRPGEGQPHLHALGVLAH